jgi:hypothetical protein
MKPSRAHERDGSINSLFGNRLWGAQILTKPKPIWRADIWGDLRHVRQPFLMFMASQRTQLERIFRKELPQPDIASASVTLHSFESGYPGGDLAHFFARTPREPLVCNCLDEFSNT